MDKRTWKLTEEQRNVICERYQQGESTRQVAKALGLSKWGVQYTLKKRGVTLRENTPELWRTYSCDHHFFDEIDSEAKAYWLGFLLADGCVYHTQGGSDVVSINLQSRDEDHLGKLLESLASNHVIRHSSFDNPLVRNGEQRRHYARIDIASRELASALASHGIVSRKTQGHITPEIREDLKRHFYRGYVDGDGGFGVYQNSGYPSVAFYCVGVRSFLDDFAAWLSNVSDIPLRLSKAVSHTTVIQRLHYTGTHQVAAISRVLYADATVYLDRKMSIVQDIWALAPSVRLQANNTFHS